MDESYIQENKYSKLIRSFKLSDALILAGIPLFANLLIFIVEVGYFSVFGLPQQLISFDLAETFVASSFLLSVVFITFMIIRGISKFLFALKLPPVITHKFQYYFPGFLILVSLIYLFTNQWKEWIGIFIVLIFFATTDFIFPIFTQRKPKSYLAKLAKAQERYVLTDKKVTTILDEIILLFGKNITKVMLYFLIILILAFQTGRSVAINKESFLIVNSEPETVVLYMARNYAIISPFDRKEKEIDPEFKILNFSSDQTYTFHREQLGHVKVKNNN